ncbi:hypothetical protein LMJ53_16720 [Rheinheimera sp. UJ51]|uniref:hypothetical protein n=1 Tax=Rheinheimera sp. UJ51 TaxID=2892446 RepID=UPI001E5E7B40|nr:hypothetical protein [Rheinheimera sp. UJ51]MCC5453360.1 hypothetical protein [Rheinheimera sp. UJ51]
MSLHQNLNSNKHSNILALSPQRTLLYAELNAYGEINPSQYIVLCHSLEGSATGLYISSSIQEQFAFHNFVKDDEMLFVLSEYERHMADFCQAFSTEFEQLFAVAPDVYFAAAKLYWHYKAAC